MCMEEKLKQYCNRGLTTYEISNKIGVSRGTVMNRLKQFGLKTKFKRGQVKNNIGSTGQISSKRKICWELNHPLRIDRLLLEHPDMNFCFTCKSQKNLNVHHKDENRKNNKKDNIEVLCRSCHSKRHDTGKYFPQDRGWSKRR